MKKIMFLFFVALSVENAFAQNKDAASAITIKALRPVSFNEVALTDKFWLPRLATQQETLIPFAFEKTQPAVDNLTKTGNFLKGIKGELPFPHRYVTSDLFKVMEGAAYLLQTNPDEKLETKMDAIIDIIGDAQQPDGYMYDAHITGVSKNHDHWGGGGMGDKPYSWVVHSHELYNMGHMYEAAVAYYQATGKKKWLEIAEKNAQHINKVFFIGDPAYNNGKPIMQAPGHQELELALIKLHRVTGKQLYLDMADKFLTIRGVSYVPKGEGVMAPDYAQQHLPVRAQAKAVGHSVRAAYQYAAMADVRLLKGDKSYDQALHHIWNNIVDTKMHITGGLGAVHGIEGFGPEYVLPNKEAYNETCAAVANVFFNYRMFLMENDGKYMDVAELALFNNALAGVNIEGNKFFYVNPLESDGITPFNGGKTGRSPWFGTACCPTNIARLIPQVSGMMYAHTDTEIYCALYGSNETSIQLAQGQVDLKQKSNYPFDGQIAISVSPEKNNQDFSLMLRIPTWTGSQFSPGKLYQYVNEVKTDWYITVNGKKISPPVEKGFARISRTWNTGDQVALHLPMPVRYSKADERVQSDKNRIAVSRGPLIYCAETIDNKGLPQQFFLGQIPIEGEEQIALLNSGPLREISSIRLPAKMLSDGEEKQSYLSLIPYYAWNNRGEGAMNVWFPTKAAQVRSIINSAVSDRKFESIAASHTFEQDDLFALTQYTIPKSSKDKSVKRWTSWPKKGEPQWLEIELTKPTDLKSIGLYWYDDNGGVQVPQSWSIQYEEKEKWVDLPLYVTDSYGTLTDQYNVVHPGKKIVTRRIKILIFPRDDAAAGLLSLQIDEIKQ